MPDRHLTDMSPRVLDEHLTDHERWALRKLCGGPWSGVVSLHPSWQRLISRGLVETDGKRITITEKGRRKVGS